MIEIETENSKICISCHGKQLFIKPEDKYKGPYCDLCKKSKKKICTGTTKQGKQCNYKVDNTDNVCLYHAKENTYCVSCYTDFEHSKLIKKYYCNDCDNNSKLKKCQECKWKTIHNYCKFHVQYCPACEKYKSRKNEFYCSNDSFWRAFSNGWCNECDSNKETIKKARLELEMQHNDTSDNDNNDDDKDIYKMLKKKFKENPEKYYEEPEPDPEMQYSDTSDDDESENEIYEKTCRQTTLQEKGQFKFIDSDDDEIIKPRVSTKAKFNKNTKVCTSCYKERNNKHIKYCLKCQISKDLHQCRQENCKDKTILQYCLTHY